MAAILSALNPIADLEAAIDRTVVSELARIAQSEAFRLDALISNLLDLSRLEAGALKPRQEPHDVEDVVGAALAEARNRQKRQIAIAVQPTLPLVSIDFALIENVVVNLLDNAIKYSPADSVVNIDAALAGNEVEIRVSDRGCGVPVEERQAIFGKFARGSGTDHTPGIGLGLPICKGFIEAHRGKIWVEERPGGGSVFCFTLPISHALAEAARRTGDA